MTKIDQTICKLLTTNSYEWIISNAKAWKYFKKSQYYQYLENDLSEYQNDYWEITDSVKNYAEQFSEATRYLNLY